MEKVRVKGICEVHEREASSAQVFATTRGWRSGNTYGETSSRLSRQCVRLLIRLATESA
jgi:hypothetical protein